MRKSLVVAFMVLATALTAVPVIAAEQDWHVSTNRVNWGTLTIPAGQDYTDEYAPHSFIAMISDEPLVLDIRLEVTRPRDYINPGLGGPFIIEDQELNGVALEYCMDPTDPFALQPG